MALESATEQEVVGWAAANGWKSYKLNGYGDRGKPDRLFGKDGKAVFIEFKAPGKPARKLQERELRQWEQRGFATLCTDDFSSACRFLQAVDNA